MCLRAKAAQKIGSKVFYKNEPVIYFDSLKTSSLEGQATTVYAQGGRGNARLMAWEGERTVTFTMEDALISPVSFSILSGAGLIEAKDKPIIVHTTEQVGTDKITLDNTSSPSYVEITLKEKPYIRTNNLDYNDNEDFIYVMVLDENGEVKSEPYIAVETIIETYVKTSDTELVPGKVYYAQSGQNAYTAISIPDVDNLKNYYEVEYPKGSESEGYKIRVYKEETSNYLSDDGYGSSTPKILRKNDLTLFKTASAVLVDYYVEHKSGAYEIDITPDKFGGNFYLEASTLFRAENGQDMPAEFIIPNCKVQSNFTFSMASSGDPSTFTFTMDAFPDYTRWNKEKKVFAAIQVIDTAETNANELERLGNPHNSVLEDGTTLDSNLKEFYEKNHKPFIELD